MKKSFDWAVVGAGPAGITAIGKLVELKVRPENILWLDPEFKVGDLGRLWQNVPSNTKVSLFTDYLDSFSLFREALEDHEFHLQQLPKAETCKLKYMVWPLQIITNHICRTVSNYQAKVTALFNKDGIWEITTSRYKFKATRVILATGASPKLLDYPYIKTIPLQLALDEEKIKNIINNDSSVAVFGSSHSAILALKNLIEQGVKEVINFYHSPLCYAKDMGDWILNDNTGLKGTAATWAKAYLEPNKLDNLTRVHSNQANIEEYLPKCDKAIYAIGFKPRNDIMVNNIDINAYCQKTGVIAPNLFGIGIAYPERALDPYGNEELQVGIWKFLQYINKVARDWCEGL